MISALTNGVHDSLHTGDWPVTEAGFLVPVQFGVNDSNSLQASALVLASRIYDIIPSVRAVYLRGSAIESNRLDLIRDLDVVVVFSTSDEDPQALAGIAASSWLTGKELTRCDLSCVTLDKIREQPFSTVMQLMLAFRATLLAGVPVWDEAPKVKADLQLALRCQDNHRRLVTRFIEKASMAPNLYDPAFLVSWMQKKSLRLGSILTMGLSQRFSRHPTRCSTLISETYPELAELAARVTDDYVVGRSNGAAWHAARGLFCALAERGDALQRTSFQH